MKRAILKFSLFLVAGSLAAQQPDAVFRAMRDELARSMKKLQLEQLEKPYFIAYRVVDTDSKTAAASFGSLTTSAENRSRTLSVEVRVGDYALDNTNFFSSPFSATGVVHMFGGRISLSLDDNYDELRRDIWLATDGAYKKALDDLAKKRAALENKNRTDVVPDFSREKPAQVSDLAVPVKIDLADAQSRVKELSGVFSRVPGLFTSQVRLEAANVLTRYLNSEGTTFTRQAPWISLTANASTQAADGMPLADFVAVYGRSVSELPSKERLAEMVRSMATRLDKLRDAPVVDRYNGPVLFEGEAAAELFNQVFAPQILGTPRMISARSDTSEEDSLLDKIGAHVLPESLKLVDNATQASFQQAPLLGGYKVDEDGVPSRETVLVENGILKTLLTGRAPVRGILQSTGNRRAAGAMPSNLLLTSQKTMPPDALRAELLRVAKQRGRDYGIVVRRIGNPALRGGRPGARLEPVIVAIKVFPDGREELVRNATISGFNVSTFKEILAVSDQPVVYTAPAALRNAGPGGGGSAPVVSFVIPSLLFEDVTVQKPSGEVSKPPFSKPPTFER